ECLVARLHVEDILERHAEPLVQAPLGEAVRHGRPLGQPLGELQRLLLELLGGDHAVHEADPQRLLRVDDVGEQDQLHGLGRADEAREEVCPATVRHETHAREHLAEARRVGRDAEIGGQGDVHAGSCGHAVDAADNRLRQPLHAEDAAVQALDERPAEIALEERRRALAAPLLIAARRECPAGAGEDDRSHGGVGFELDEDALDLAHHRLVHGVEGLGPVEREGRDAVAPLVENGSVRHSRAPSSFASSPTMVRTIRQASVEIQGYSVASGQEKAMSGKRREMHFGVFVLGTGNHSAGWRYDGAATSNNDLAVIQEIARQAERGKFDLLFVSDGLVMDPGDHPSFLCRFEPTTLISALSASTSHIGLGATVSTSFGEPYHVARTFGSIDHITGGRAAWNVVTSSAGKAALNFSREAHMEHDLRYEVAQEFVDVVKGLWDCWEDGAIVADKATGVFIDASKVRPLDHRGRFFQVKGPINMARCPQGHPVIIQAAGSEAGLELAARTADVVFSVVQELSAARRAYRDLKGRMAKYGRTPDQITVLPGVMPIIGSTEAEARDKLSRLQSWLTPTNALTLVTSRIGYDVTGFPLDGPVPAPPPDASSQTFSRVLYETARRENMTLRDLYNLTAAARGHWVLCGTPKHIADTLEEWFVEEAADGFNVLPPYFPGALSDFVDLVVPELQARGLFRREYGGT